MNTRRSAIIAALILLFVVQVGLLAYAAQKSDPSSAGIYVVLVVASGIVDAVICTSTIKRADALREAYKEEADARIATSLAEYGERTDHVNQISLQLARNVDAELTSAQEALERGDLEDLTTHLRKSVRIASNAVTPKCANVMVSALLVSKETECAELGVELQAHVALPTELPVLDDVAGAILLYLIEKAVNECRTLADEGTLPADATIVVRSKVSAGQFFVQVLGPCQPHTNLRGDNSLTYVSTIVQEHGGVTSYEQKGTAIDLSAMLPVTP